MSGDRAVSVGLSNIQALIDDPETSAPVRARLQGARALVAAGWLEDEDAEHALTRSKVVSDANRLITERDALAKVADAWDEGYRLDWTGGIKHANPYRTANPTTEPKS